MSWFSHDNPTRLIAIRHGETAWNVSTRIQGQLDIGLNAVGQRQAEQAAQALSGEEIHAIYSSDLLRAWSTAQEIAKPHGITVQTDIGLRERGFGEFEGHTFKEIEAQFPDQALQWRKRVPEFAPAGGESLRQFHERVIACVSTLCAQHPGQHIVIVAHGGVMDLLYRAATKLDLQDPRTWQLDNASINRLLWSKAGGLHLVGWNDTAHLEDGALDEGAA
jgi:2,3-bisphosphoglycerate-dependent phosphoglycerate mutase